MYKKSFLILVISGLITSTIYAEDLDSLKKRIPYLQNEELVDSYLLIGRLSFEQNSDIPELIKYSNIGLNKSQKILYVPGIINSLTYLGIAYSLQGEVIKSNIYYENALKLAIKAKDFTSIADLESKIGYNYDISSDYKSALDHYFKAAETMEDLHNYIGLTITYNNIAGIFSTQGQTEECLIYLHKSLAIVDKLKDPVDKMVVYSSVSTEMIELAQSDPVYLDSAMVYALRGLPIAIENKYQRRTGIFYLQLSRIFSLKGNDQKAKDYFEKAQEYRGSLSQDVLLLYYLRATDHYIKQQKDPLALKYIDSTYLELQSNMNELFGVEISKRSYELNKKLGNYQEALIAHEKLRDFESNIFNDERISQVNAIQQKFNKAQNEKTISQLNQEKQLLNKNKQIDRLKINLLVFGIILLLAMILLVIFLYRQKQIKQKKEILEVELRLNRSRMNPHFFFNALTSIQTLALKDGKTQEVSFYISKFSKIMRSSLESTYNELASLEDEMEFLRQYIDIQKFYSDNKFSYIIEISDEIEPSEYYIPSMILQPFIENSIEHGFKNISQLGKILIRFEKKNNELYIHIVDNGSGFKEQEKHKSYPSRASQIVKDRLFLLNKKYHSSASYAIRNLENKQGMEVIINLPIITQK